MKLNTYETNVSTAANIDLSKNEIAPVHIRFSIAVPLSAVSKLTVFVVIRRNGYTIFHILFLLNNKF